MEDAALAEMKRLLFDAPIAELAESQGISIDEAVALRVEKSIEAAPVPVEVSVRPIEPQGKLLGFASVKIGGVVIDDFKVVDGRNGMFLSPPSKEAPGTRSGYRSTARVLDRGCLRTGGRKAGGACTGAAPHPDSGTAGGSCKGCGKA